MYLEYVCLIHRTTYSVSDSVNSTGKLDDLNNGPRLANSGIAESCSESILMWSCKYYTSNILMSSNIKVTVAQVFMKLVIKKSLERHSYFFYITCWNVLFGLNCMGL